MLQYTLRKMKTPKLIEYAQEGVFEALELLVERYQNLVLKLANQYYGSWAEKSDIVQNGFVGLLKAVFYYKSEKEANFTTFAWTNIDSEMKTFLTYLNRKKNKMLSDSVSYDYSPNDGNDEEEEGNFSIFDNEVYVDQIKNNYLVGKTMFRLENEVSLEEIQVFRMSLDNYSYKDIASGLSMNLKKVDNIIQKSRKKFKEIFMEEKKFYEMTEEWFRGDI